MSSGTKAPKTAFEKHPTSSSFLESFANLQRFRASDTFTDVTFVVDGKTFTAHKLVLAAHSPVFLAMFANPMLEASSGQVVVGDVKPKIFEIFLNYLYTGIDPSLDANGIAELLVCADKYGVNPLMVTCENVLCKMMTAKNVIDIYSMAEAYNRPVLSRRALHCMALYMSDIVQTEGWDLIKDRPEKLKKIIYVMRKRLEQFSYLDFERPRGRKRDLLLGKDPIKVLVRVDRNTKNHLRPQEFKFKIPTTHQPSSSFMRAHPVDQKAEILGHVVLFEDECDGGRLVVTVRFAKVLDWPLDSLPLVLNITVSDQGNPDDPIVHQTVPILWSRSSHPTMGLPPYVIYEETQDHPLPKRGTFFIEITFDKGLSTEQGVPKNYIIIEQCDKVVTEFPTSKNNFVHITDDNSSSWNVPLGWLPARARYFSGSQKTIQVVDVPTESIDRLIRYLHSRNKKLNQDVMPSRDIVDLPMLKAACQLRLDYDLILYLEHALVWDLDPSNCLSSIEVGRELGLGFLKHGALLYFKIHSKDILKRFPDTWEHVKSSVLKEILLDLNRNVFVLKNSFLPGFLTMPRKHIPQIKQRGCDTMKRTMVPIYRYDPFVRIRRIQYRS